MSKVELVAKTVPQIEGVSTAEFAAYIARIGKVKDNPERLMKYLLNHKHFSPFEHTYFTFKIQTSMSIGEQLLRHRSFTFQKQSGRYEEMTQFEPIELRKQAVKNRQSSEEVINPDLIWYQDEPYQEGFAKMEVSRRKANDYINDLLSLIREAYDMLLEEGVAKECARFILPACTSTTMLMTGNVRSWIHFLAIRDDEHAQKEAQLIAKEIKGILIKEVPNLFTEETKEQ